MAFWISFAKVIAAACGIGAVLLLIVYVILQSYLVQRKKKTHLRKPAPRPEPTLQEDSIAKGRKPVQAESRDADVGRPAFTRDPAAIQREAELKRDTLHIFRRLQAAETREEKSTLCGEAVELFDGIGDRVGKAMSSVTCGRIVFCNALMDCGGLDLLRDCQESKDPHADTLIERVIPIIFST